ncbi:MAG TPA: c-type cytochrome [Steroidobacteraceae bacterium]|jgi:cytochrome c2
MRRLSLLLLLCGLPACHGGTASHPRSEAKALIGTYCAACHTVPGVARATGRVGPSLAGIARQQILAGHFANTPDTMMNWIEHPQQLLPGDAMPDMGLTSEQARTIAAYLYTLE